MELGFWIPIVNGIPDSLSSIQNSRAQDSGIQIPLHGAKHRSQSSVCLFFERRISRWLCSTFGANQRQYQTTCALLMAPLFPRVVAATGTCFPICHRFLYGIGQCCVWPDLLPRHVIDLIRPLTVSTKYGQCNNLSLLHF